MIRPNTSGIFYDHDSRSRRRGKEQIETFAKPKMKQKIVKIIVIPAQAGILAESTQ